MNWPDFSKSFVTVNFRCDMIAARRAAPMPTRKWLASRSSAFPNCFLPHPNGSASIRILSALPPYLDGNSADFVKCEPYPFPKIRRRNTFSPKILKVNRIGQNRKQCNNEVEIFFHFVATLLPLRFLIVSNSYPHRFLFENGL